MSGYLPPMLLLTGASFANHWYNTGDPDLVILLEGAIATGILALAAEIPGFSGAATGIAWLAFFAMMIAPIQNPSPVQNLLTITGKGAKSG